MKAMIVYLLPLMSFSPFFQPKNYIEPIPKIIQRTSVNIQKKTVPNKIMIIDGYSGINTIPEMLVRFKGDLVFIDMWATWCEPCIKEFSYSDSLYRFLSDRKVAMLYVSFDKDGHDKKWRTVIRSHKLYGSHIRANKKLMDELSNLIWGAPGGIGIPHFLIFDKNGEILNKDAPFPSSKNELYKVIEKEIVRLN